MNNRILWISPYAPYDTVGHAGGKTHNYYVKRMKAMGFDIELLTLCCKREVKMLDLDQYQINYVLEVVDGSDYKFYRVRNGLSILNPFQKYCRILLPSQHDKIMKMVKKFSDCSPKPDVVILQWTMVIFMLPQIRHFFPDSKYVAIEEDVTYLSFERKYRKAKVDKLYRKYLYKKMKKEELKMLSMAELVIVNNNKDAKLLKSDGFSEDKILVAAPYYDDYAKLKRDSGLKKDIIFWGSMKRIENEQSALWFIDNVMPILKDMDVRFVVVGSEPSARLRRRENERIKIAGFVQDVSDYFIKGLCLAAPLQMGAGIKVKILEAFSAGIPVLTNDIGIEGIPARDGKEYLHCETPKEYALAIRRLHTDCGLERKLSQNARLLVEKEFNYHKKVVEMAEKIRTL